MTIRYVWSGAGGAGTGADWTNAYTTFGAAVTASNATGDLIYVADDHNESLAADTTYTFAAHVAAIGVNRTSGLPNVGAFIGHASSNFSITIQGAFRVFIYGIKFQIAGSATDSLSVNLSDGGHFELENCSLFLINTSVSSRIAIGGSGTSLNIYTRLVGCTLKFGSTSQAVNARSVVDFESCTCDASGSAPTTLLQSSGAGGTVKVQSSDLSVVTGSLIGDYSFQTAQFTFTQCKLGSGVTVLASQTTAPNKGGASAWVYDCASGDQHYHIAHYDAFGSTVVDTGIYANDGAQYDGTNRCSWKIATTANCSYYTPYASPWFGRYHSATSAITPYIEILRDGSTTAYQDDEVWGEFSAKTTTGSTQSTLYNDRMTLLGTPANQAAGVGTSGWTGENASAWSGKLAPGSSFTPAEIGHLMARVVVGEPSITVYVDPAIRGA